MMNISLVVPNYMNSRTFLQPPVELYTSARILKNAGHIVNVYDFRVIEQTVMEATKTINQQTDLIIISTSPYDMTQMYHMDYRYSYVKYFSFYIKKSFPNVYVFGEGAQCTLKPEEFLEQTGTDGVILWEIERTLLDLVETLKKHESIEKVPNLVLKQRNHSYLRTAFEEDYAHPSTKYFDVIPMWENVDYSKYFGYDLERSKYERVSRWGVILGSRGCAYSCSFCFNFYRNVNRYRDVNRIADEMELMYNLNVNRVFFLDMTFTQNRNWTKSLCDELISRKNRLKWICQTRCDCIDEELISIMKNAGCCGIEFGIETYNDANLDILNKRINTAMIADAINMCQNIGVLTSAFLMVGTPFETNDSIKSTIEMLKQKNISFIPIIYTPRLGSLLGDEIAEKYNVHEWKQLLNLRGKLSSKYSIEDLINDHSVLKGESMGTVSTDFKNTDLGCDMGHHRMQINESLAMYDGSTLEGYIRNCEVKHNENDIPFVSFPIVSSCPFSCIYCGQGGENTISPVSTINLETLMEIAVYLKRAGVKKIRLTGGEPLTHPQIGDIIRFLSEAGFYVLINTNGLLVEDKIDCIMRTASNIHFAVSLDTLDPVKFDSISQTKGNFDKVLRGITILKKLGYLMRINMVVGDFNIDEVDDMITYCKKMQCDLKLQEVASVPYPNSEWNDIHVDLACLEKSFASKARRIIVHDYARSFGIPVKIYDMDGVYVTLKAMGVGSRYDINGICKDCPHLYCHEGLYDIYILADGSIATCRWCRFGSLDTFEEDLKNAIETFQHAEYIGGHPLEKMTRTEKKDERISRL